MLTTSGKRKNGDVCPGTYMLQEAVADLEGIILALAESLEEVTVVELVDLLQVAEDSAALASQTLRYVITIHLGEVVLSENEREKTQKEMTRPAQGKKIGSGTGMLVDR